MLAEVLPGHIEVVGGLTRLSHKQNSSREPNRGSKQDKFLQGGPPFET